VAGMRGTLRGFRTADVGAEALRAARQAAGEHRGAWEATAR
jgi:uncharacterized protein